MSVAGISNQEMALIISSYSLAHGTRRKRLQIDIRRVEVGVVDCLQGLERHHLVHSRSVRTLARAHHRSELLGRVVTRHHGALAGREVRGGRPVWRAAGDLAAGEALAVA